MYHFPKVYPDPVCFKSCSIYEDSVPGTYSTNGHTGMCCVRSIHTDSLGEVWESCYLVLALSQGCALKWLQMGEDVKAMIDKAHCLK